MAATGLFTVNFTKEEVLAIQAKAKALVTEGVTIMNYGDSGTSVGKQFSLSPERVLEECAYALQKLDPTTYGRAPRVLFRTDYGRTPFQH